MQHGSKHGSAVKPNKPLSAYNRFVQAEVAKAKAADASVNYPDLFKAIASSWNGLSTEAKAAWKEDGAAGSVCKEQSSKEHMQY